MIRAGELRHKVTIEFPIRTRNATGERALTWDGRLTAWAEVKPLASREDQQSAKQVARTTHQVRMRFNPRLRPDCRLRYQGRVLNIVGIVDVEERHEEHRLQCSEEARA